LERLLFHNFKKIDLLKVGADDTQHTLGSLQIGLLVIVALGSLQIGLQEKLETHEQLENKSLIFSSAQNRPENK
jgi:hypothetical protein